MTSVADISPTELRDFAKSLGWTQLRANFAPGLYVLRNATHPGRELLLPESPEMSDYEQAITNVVEKLAYLHHLTVERVLTGVAELGRDVIRYRIYGDRVKSSEIPLVFAKQVLNAAEVVLLSSAATLFRPRLHHPRLSSLEVQEVLGSAKLGQTEEGSFVVKIACSVHASEIEVPMGEGRLPLVRAATLKAQRSMQQLVTAIESDTVERMIDGLKAAELPDTSANFFEALTKLHDEDLNNDLDVDFGLASTEPQDQEVPERPVRIRRSYFPIIEDVRRELRSTEGPQVDLFMGSVEALQGQIGEDGRRFGDVILALFVEGELVRARVSLDSDQYEVADRAHMTNGAYIFVRGSLHTGRQPRVLVDVDLFQQALPGFEPPRLA